MAGDDGPHLVPPDVLQKRGVVVPGDVCALEGADLELVELFWSPLIQSGAGGSAVESLRRHAENADGLKGEDKERLGLHLGGVGWVVWELCRGRDNE